MRGGTRWISLCRCMAIYTLLTRKTSSKSILTAPRMNELSGGSGQSLAGGGKVANKE